MVSRYGLLRNVLNFTSFFLAFLINGQEIIPDLAFCALEEGKGEKK